MNDALMAETALMDASTYDLFGEPADSLVSNGLSAALSAPLPPGLVLRIAEMQNRGCCT